MRLTEEATQKPFDWEAAVRTARDEAVRALLKGHRSLEPEKLAESLRTTQFVNAYAAVLEPSLPPANARWEAIRRLHEALLAHLPASLELAQEDPATRDRVRASWRRKFIDEARTAQAAFEERVEQAMVASQIMQALHEGLQL